MKYEEIFKQLKEQNEITYNDTRLNYLITLVDCTIDGYILELYMYPFNDSSKYMKFEKIETVNDIIQTLYLLTKDFNVKYISVNRDTCLDILYDCIMTNDFNGRLLYSIEEKNIECVDGYKKTKKIKVYGIKPTKDISLFESTIIAIENLYKKSEKEYKYYFNNPDQIKNLDDKSKKRMAEEIYNNAKYLVYWIEETHPSLDDIMNKIWEE